MQKKTLRTGDTLEGTINISAKGIGYIKMKEYGETIEVPRADLGKAFSGDIVEVLVAAQIDGENPRGVVKSIIRRARVGYSGTLAIENGAHCMVTGDGKMYTNIDIPEAGLKGAKAGDKVFCRITDWPTSLDTPKGEVVRVLGKPLENDAEMLSLALEKGFEDEYPQAVLDEAQKIHEHGITEEEKATRRDFRKTVTFTIDPADAKDFDDAISVAFLENGNTEIGIHIADVSHYVTPGSALDTEAYRRATSVYLVDRTIPMLPEVLSNELCSLNPNVDRLTMSAVFTFDKNNHIVEEWYGKTVIHSAYRYTYETAQEVLDKQEGSYLRELNAALAIGKYLEKERFANGAISIDSEEVKFKLDDKGVPIGVYIKHRGDTHHMIEELMLLANRKVAERITKEKDRIFVYRIHPKPELDRMQDLYMFLKRLGYNVLRDEDGIIPSSEINRTLKELDGKPEKDTIQTAIARSMAKAIYSTKNIGHYGLAFEFYTHFTSPIRRYPDTIVHRLLTEYLQNNTIAEEHWAYYDKVCNHSSQREKEATDAERASIKYKQTEYMTYRIGQTFSGSVTGVSPNGIFVEEKESKCEGMIRLRELGADYFEYNEKELAIVGKRTGKSFRIGDAVTFKVVAADLNKRIIDYVLI